MTDTKSEILVTLQSINDRLNCIQKNRVQYVETMMETKAYVKLIYDMLKMILTNKQKQQWVQYCKKEYNDVCTKLSNMTEQDSDDD